MDHMKIKLVVIALVFCLASCKQQESNSLNDLRQQITERFDSIKGDFAMAFLDLKDSSNQLLINADQSFHAASTMKVPVMMELFKRAGEGEFSLNDSIAVKNEFKSIVDQSLYSLDTIDDSELELYKMLGQNRSIYDLNYDMIIWSSNLATNILIELADAKKVTATMRSIGAMNIEVLRGVEDQKAYDQGLSNATTARDLMVIFEAIDKSRIGSKADNKEMIKILLDQQFNEIIPALLPEDVQVAHKTGVITALHHDAGIVYLPNGNKYVLVLLSKNLGDFEQGTGLMAEVSRMVYDYIKGN